MNKELKILILSTTLFLVAAIYYSLFIVPVAQAATNIDSTYRWAWNDVIGWIDFYSTANVNVTSTQLTGYASSSIGFIALDCATAPSPNCVYPYKVSNEGNGNLSGWAWSDVIGWISFDSASATSSYPYQVTISSLNGDFSGWAWNDVVGWISFNCADINNCGTAPNHKVKTSWQAGSSSGTLTSSIFDTQVAGGSAINTIMWQGSKPSGSNVRFQIASSNSTSTWNYIGPDGSNTTYYTPTDAGIPVQINLAQHNNKRYFRYQIFLESDAGRTVSPRVDDVIINYSP